MSVTEKVVWNWNETNRYIEGFKQEVPEEKCITVRSEELFNEVDSTLELLHFCGAQGLSRRTISSLQDQPVNTSRASTSSGEGLSDEKREEVRVGAVLAERYGYTI